MSPTRRRRITRKLFLPLLGILPMTAMMAISGGGHAPAKVSPAPAAARVAPVHHGVVQAR